MLEKKYNNFAYFITLTYDDDHIHTVPTINKTTGEVIAISTLRKKDLQDFIKRYRRVTETHDFGKCRYYACGEYGENSNRRHMHMIMYQENEIPDLKYYKQNREHQEMFTSELVNEIWGKGYCVIAGVTLESAGYVARYIMKKQTGEAANIYKELNIEPEFVTMSLKPGIGQQAFIDEWYNIYRNDMVIMPNMKGKRQKLKPPRYFDEQLFERDPDYFREIKDHRRDIAIIRRNQKESMTTSDTWEETEQKVRAAKQSILHRKEI